jgi:hypothetical protein
MFHTMYSDHWSRYLNFTDTLPDIRTHSLIATTLHNHYGTPFDPLPARLIPPPLA